MLPGSGDLTAMWRTVHEEQRVVFNVTACKNVVIVTASTARKPNTDVAYEVQLGQNGMARILDRVPGTNLIVSKLFLFLFFCCESHQGVKVSSGM